MRANPAYVSMIAPRPASIASQIVVAEDEWLIRMAAVDVLTEAGFIVLEAQHAEDALAILTSRHAHVHLLFTDIHMPGEMNGLGLAHHTRFHWPWIALLLASGKARPHHTELPDESRFLSKPYSFDAMVGHARELAEFGRRAAAARLT